MKAETLLKFIASVIAVLLVALAALSFANAQSPECPATYPEACEVIVNYSRAMVQLQNGISYFIAERGVFEHELKLSLERETKLNEKYGICNSSLGMTRDELNDLYVRFWITLRQLRQARRQLYKLKQQLR